MIDDPGLNNRHFVTLRLGPPLSIAMAFKRSLHPARFRAVRTFVGCFAGLTLLVACSSESPKPPVQVELPNVYELRLSKAESALQSVGLRIADDLVGPCPSGAIHFNGNSEPIVFVQQPTARSKVPKSSVVHLHTC